MSHLPAHIFMYHQVINIIFFVSSLYLQYYHLSIGCPNLKHNFNCNIASTAGFLDNSALSELLCYDQSTKIYVALTPATMLGLHDKQPFFMLFPVSKFHMWDTCWNKYSCMIIYMKSGPTRKVRQLQHKFQSVTVPYKANIYKTANKLQQSWASLDKWNQNKMFTYQHPNN